MKSLTTLVKAHKTVLDEKRRALNVLEEKVARLTGARAELADEKRREADLVRNGDGYGFGGYLVGVRMRDEALHFGLEALAGEIEVARDEFAEAFAEIKRLELIEAAQAERARKQEAQREQQELDELGLSIFRRGENAEQ